MNKLLLLILSIYCVFCSMDECDESTDQSRCNSIEVEDENFYCFKNDHYFFEEEDDPEKEEESEKEKQVKNKCLVFPKSSDNQKLFSQMYYGLFKEVLSSYGKSLPDEFGDGDVDVFESIGANIMKAEKETYALDEIIKTGPYTFSSDEKEILLGENTCAFNTYGELLQNPTKPFTNIIDKNICFNATQFDEWKNLIDCGYATYKFNVKGKDYEIKTCHYVPTSKFPQALNFIYMYFLQGYSGALFNELLLHASGNGGTDELVSTYDIEVENKYGRKVKYSSENDMNFEIIAEGSVRGEEVEGTESAKGTEQVEGTKGVEGTEQVEDTKGIKGHQQEEKDDFGSYININLMLLFLLFGF